MGTHGVEITHGGAILTDAPRNLEGRPIPHSPIPANSPLGSAIERCFPSLSRTGSARVTRVATVSLGDYPEGAVLPDPDMMATLALSAGPGNTGTAFVSFPPEQAISLIEVWSDSAPSGAEALGCYRRGARALAEAALGGLGFEAGASDSLEEDALVATLLATHAPADTSVFTAEIRIVLDEGECTGVFVLLADAKVLGSLVERAAA